MHLQQHEDEHGQPLPGREGEHEQAYHDLVEAVYGLADQGRLQSILSFTREDLSSAQARALTWDVTSLASRMELQMEDGRISSTRLFAIPLAGPGQPSTWPCQSEDFGVLVAGCPQFPQTARIALLGATSIEAAASLDADTLVRLTRALDEALESGDMERLGEVAPILGRLALQEGEGDEGDAMRHLVVLGACRHVEAAQAMTQDDPLEIADPGMDQAWVDAFTRWCEQHPRHAGQPWVSSPPAKWEVALADAVVQRVLMELAITAAADTGGEDLPRACFYRVEEGDDGISIEGRLEDGRSMGVVKFGGQASWLLPKAIEEWRSWGCQVECQGAATGAAMRPARMH